MVVSGLCGMIRKVYEIFSCIGPDPVGAVAVASRDRPA
jgi:hypothetical protein